MYGEQGAHSRTTWRLRLREFRFRFFSPPPQLLLFLLANRVRNVSFQSHTIGRWQGCWPTFASIDVLTSSPTALFLCFYPFFTFNCISSLFFPWIRVSERVEAFSILGIIDSPRSCYLPWFILYFSIGWMTSDFVLLHGRYKGTMIDLFILEYWLRENVVSNVTRKLQF